MDEALQVLDKQDEDFGSLKDATEVLVNSCFSTEYSSAQNMLQLFGD